MRDSDELPDWLGYTLLALVVLFLASQISQAFGINNLPELLALWN